MSQRVIATGFSLALVVWLPAFDALSLRRAPVNHPCDPAKVVDLGSLKPDQNNYVTLSQLTRPLDEQLTSTSSSCGSFWGKNPDLIASLPSYSRTPSEVESPPTLPSRTASRTSSTSTLSSFVTAQECSEPDDDECSSPGSPVDIRCHPQCEDPDPEDDLAGQDSNNFIACDAAGCERPCNPARYKILVGQDGSDIDRLSALVNNANEIGSRCRVSSDCSQGSVVSEIYCDMVTSDVQYVEPGVAVQLDNLNEGIQGINDSACCLDDSRAAAEMLGAKNFETKVASPNLQTLIMEDYFASPERGRGDSLGADEVRVTPIAVRAGEDGVIYRISVDDGHHTEVLDVSGEQFNEMTNSVAHHYPQMRSDSKKLFKHFGFHRKGIDPTGVKALRLVHWLPEIIAKIGGVHKLARLLHPKKIASALNPMNLVSAFDTGGRHDNEGLAPILRRPMSNSMSGLPDIDQEVSDASSDDDMQSVASHASSRSGYSMVSSSRGGAATPDPTQQWKYEKWVSIFAQHVYFKTILTPKFMGMHKVFPANNIHWPRFHPQPAITDDIVLWYDQLEALLIGVLHGSQEVARNKDRFQLYERVKNHVAVYVTDAIVPDDPHEFEGVMIISWCGTRSGPGYKPEDSKEDSTLDFHAFFYASKKLGRFQDAALLTDDLMRKYPHARIILTGHSLGGALALHAKATVYKTPRVSCVVMNAYAANNFKWGKIMKSLRDPHVTIVANFHDVVVRTVHYILGHAKDIKATIVSVSYARDFSWIWQDTMLKHGIWQFLPDMQFETLARLRFFDMPDDDPESEDSGTNKVTRLRANGQVTWIEIQY